MVYNNLLSATLNLPRTPAFLQPFLVAKKVEGRSIRTLEWYQESLSDFKAFCEDNGLGYSPEKIEASYVRAWLASLQDRKLKKSTVNNRFRALSGFLSWCIGEGIINDSPLKNIHTPSIGKSIVPVFNPDHVRAMLYLCPPNVWWGARDRAIILTFLHTGIRLSELCSLNLLDINFNNEDIKIIGKGDKERRIYLDKEAQRSIISWIKHRSDNSEALFISRHGLPISSNAVQQMINKLGKRAGIKEIRCSAHTFRHTFAVNFLKAGGSVRHLQEIMGHTSMKPLEVYLRTIAADDAIEVHKNIQPFSKWKL
jgi:site-specific recombinase XerD